LTHGHDVLRQGIAKGVQFIATGDPEQIEPVCDREHVVYVSRQSRYRYMTHPEMFPRVLYFSTNKRVHPEDRHKLDALVDPIKDTHNDVSTLGRRIMECYPDKVLTSLDQVKAKGICKGITYYNESKAELNKLIHAHFPHSTNRASQRKTLSNGVTYYYDGLLVYNDESDSQFRKNYSYKIVGMARNEFTLQEPIANLEIKVPVADIVSRFALPYCHTGHSEQGGTIQQPYVIADLLEKDVDSSWLYTAVTRLHRFDHLSFLIDNLRPSKEKRLAAAKAMIQG
jgi:hypothetical protein